MLQVRQRRLDQLGRDGWAAEPAVGLKPMTAPETVEIVAALGALDPEHVDRGDIIGLFGVLREGWKKYWSIRNIFQLF